MKEKSYVPLILKCFAVENYIILQYQQFFYVTNILMIENALFENIEQI